MGDAAGIGPELIVRAWLESPLLSIARPVVIGHVGVLKTQVRRFATQELHVKPIANLNEAEPTPGLIPCLEPSTVDLSSVLPGHVDGKAGRAAYDFLVTAIDLALEKELDAIVTLPINKESFHLAGVPFPGHTEILADRCSVSRHAMMLYLPPIQGVRSGLGVIHVTLHMALRAIFDQITIQSVGATIELADQTVRPLLDGNRPRIGVAALNPHASEHGLFGDEEERILTPAIHDASSRGISVHGPIAADTLFANALSGGFDAVVAMYHDQGHIALKTVDFDHAVNITLGLPIVRTSVAHGTAFDIVGQGIARTESLISAVEVAAKLSAG